MANTTIVRFATASNQDVTFRPLELAYATTTYGMSFVTPTYSFALNQYYNTVNLGTLTQSVSLTVATASPQIGDKLDVLAIGGSTTYSITFDSAMFKVQTSNAPNITASTNVKYAFTYNGTYFVGSGFAV